MSSNPIQFRPTSSKRQLFRPSTSSSGNSARPISTTETTITKPQVRERSDIDPSLFKGSTATGTAPPAPETSQNPNPFTVSQPNDAKPKQNVGDSNPRTIAVVAPADDSNFGIGEAGPNLVELLGLNDEPKAPETATPGPDRARSSSTQGPVAQLQANVIISNHFLDHWKEKRSEGHPEADEMVKAFQKDVGRAQRELQGFFTIEQDLSARVQPLNGNARAERAAQDHPRFLKYLENH